MRISAARRASSAAWVVPATAAVVWAPSARIASCGPSHSGPPAASTSRATYAWKLATHADEVNAALLGFLAR
jgi:hypothetical protein